MCRRIKIQTRPKLNDQYIIKEIVQHFMDTEDKKQTKQNSKEIYTINIVQVVFDIEDNKPNQTEQNSNHKKNNSQQQR